MWTVAVVFASEPVPNGGSQPPPSVPLIVDAKVPVELVFEGSKIGQLYIPSELRFQAPPGPHLLRVFVGGFATDVPLNLVPGAEVRVVVGQNGVTTSAGPVEAITGPQTVEFRLVGPTDAKVRVDKLSQPLHAGRSWTVDLAPGPHPLSLRSSDGTAIWATGELLVHGGAPITVVVTEGRLPEISGPAAFRPAGS